MHAETDKIGAHFDRLAPHYDKLVASKGWPVNEMLPRILAKVAVTHPRVLDLGAGTGATTAAIVECTNPLTVTAVDVSENMAEIMRQRFEHDPRVKIARLAIDQYLATTEETYDLVTAVGVLYYSPHPGEFINAAASVLSNNGVCVFTYNPLMPDYPPQSEPVVFDKKSGIRTYKQFPHVIDDLVAASGLVVADHCDFRPQPLANTAYIGGLVVAKK